MAICLAHAPPPIVDRLQAAHPGIYVILDDAPRPRSAVMKIASEIDPAALKSQGIDAVEWGPTEDGHLRVGVTSDVAKARAAFDAKYGAGVVRVEKGQVAAW